MNKGFRIALIFVFCITAAIFLQPVYVWLKGGGYQLTKEAVVDGTFFGIVVPALMFLSKKIKSTWLYIPLAICVMLLLVILKKFVFSV